MTYGRPGVYITERNLPSPINAGANANAAGACVGVFEKGPIDVTLVTSWYDFAKKFGGYNAAYPASFEVSQFFRNGGSELYVRRVLHTIPTDESDTEIAGYAAGDLINSDDSVIVSVTAKNPGTSGTLIRVALEGAGTVSGVTYYNLYVYLEQGTDPGTTDDILVESWRNIVLDDATSTDYIESVINGISEYIVVERTVEPVATISTDLVFLTGSGLDGATPSTDDAIASLTDFDVVDRPLVFFVPAIWKTFTNATSTLQSAVTAWCADHNSFAILDTDADLDKDAAIAAAEDIGATAHGAVYYPNVYISDPLGRSRNSLRKIGPGASVAGLALLTDRSAGVFKTPAGLRTPLTGVVSPERLFSATELDSLNSSTTPVNAIRSVPGAGVVVMGGRTLLGGTGANRYVAMRRSLNYIRKQAQTLTEFAIFEVNNSTLWSRIDTVLDVFLNEYRNQGGLRGGIPADAYFIKCDQENNTAESIANGEVNIEIGVALEYPAEFVVINLTQKTIN